MSTLKFRYILRDLNVMRLWSAWTHKYIFSTVVKRCIRDRGVREVIQRFRHTILRPKRTLLLSATAAYKSHTDDSFSCDQGISDDELQALLLELDNVQNMVQMTLYCTSCGKRLVIDRKLTDVRYCGCKEPKSENDASDGWIPYMETDDVIIWRKEYKPGKGLYAYKVYGRYPEVAASDFAAVQIDGAYRCAWDSAVAALAVVQRDARGVPGQAILHWEVLWPRLFANRDYVYIRRHKEYDITTKKPMKPQEIPTFETSVHAKAKRKSLEKYAKEKDSDIKNKVYIIVSKSCEHPDVPETKHAIRVSEYWSHMVVKSIYGTDKPGMEFVLTYYDEPCVGGMPGGVAAWASSRAAPAYLHRMRRAAADYRAWAAGRTSQELPDFIPFGPDQVNKKQAVQIQEQDMESSKQGPEMENGVTTRDQASQTDEYLIQNYTIKGDMKGDEPKNDKDKSDENGSGEAKKVQKNNESVQTKDTANDNKDTPLEGDSDKTPEEENSGGWWRYLYPFYYFV